MDRTKKRLDMEPGCGRWVNPERFVRFVHDKGDPDCRAAFGREAGKIRGRKGFWGRFLERLAGANEREFGPRGPCCH